MHDHQRIRVVVTRSHLPLNVDSLPAHTMHFRTGSKLVNSVSLWPMAILPRQRILKFLCVWFCSTTYPHTEQILSPPFFKKPQKNLNFTKYNTIIISFPTHNIRKTNHGAITKWDNWLYLWWVSWHHNHGQEGSHLWHQQQGVVPQCQQAWLIGRLWWCESGV